MMIWMVASSFFRRGRLTLALRQHLSTEIVQVGCTRQIGLKTVSVLPHLA